MAYHLHLYIPNNPNPGGEAMAAIFKKDGKHFIRFVDSEGFERVMELKEGRKYLKKEFEKRKREMMYCKNNLQKTHIISAKTSIFFTTHNSMKGMFLGV